MVEENEVTDENVGRIVATVEESALLQRLEEAEAKIAELMAAASTAAGRKTIAAGVDAMIAKHVVGVESLHAGALDAALVGLSVEQRIAVKAELLRSGLIA